MASSSFEIGPTFLKGPVPNNINWSQSKDVTAKNPTATLNLEELIFSKEVEFEVREVHDTSSSHRTLSFRIFRLGHEKDPDAFRFEIVDPEDLFFHYQTLIQSNSFRAIQTKQNLTVDFSQFHEICVKIIDDCSTASDSYTAIFKFKSDGQVKVAFFQNLGYKYIELLALEFQPSTEQEIKDHVKRTYFLLKMDSQNAKNRLAEVLNVVKAKNPSLLLYLQQSSPSPGYESIGKKASRQRP